MQSLHIVNQKQRNTFVSIYLPSHRVFSKRLIQVYLTTLQQHLQIIVS